MIVAVTGISSELGKSFVPKLQSDPSVERIVGIDISDYTANADKIQFFKADIRDSAKMESALQHVDVLFHLAFIVAPPKMPSKKKIYDININGSKTVLMAAAKNKVKKIIYLSSISVYGHVPECPQMVTEDSPRLGIMTTNFYYAHTKGIVEQFIDQFEKEHPDISVLRLRPPIIAGPHYFHTMKGFIPVGNASSRTIFPLNHNGKFPLQLIHETDLADVLLLMMQKGDRGAYNVASNAMPDLSAFIKNRYHRKIKPAPYPAINFLLALHKIIPKAGWLQALKYNSLLNTEKVEKEFNWRPKMTTEECLIEYFDSGN